MFVSFTSNPQRGKLSLALEVGSVEMINSVTENEFARLWFESWHFAEECLIIWKRNSLLNVEKFGLIEDEETFN